MKLIFLFVTFIFSVSSFAFLREPVTVHVDGMTKENRPWMKIHDTDEENVRHLLRALMKTKTGKHLVRTAAKKAANTGKTIFDVIKPGQVSITDTTLVRRFSPENPDKMAYTTESVIYIDSSHNFVDAVLDLAHEITHYNEKTPFNPYDSRFTLRRFINSTVEGKGGEVDAYLSECRVLREFSVARFERNENCHRVFNRGTKTFSRRKAVQGFYQVGPFTKMILREIRDFELDESDLPMLSADQPQFISSAYGLPYPLAAVREYTNIMGKVCENDEKRLDLLRRKIDRNPASESMGLQRQEFARMDTSFKTRCHRFIQSAPSR